MLHKLKLKEKYADRIVGGQKTFEVRLNDRDYQAGDIIIFNVVDNFTSEESINHKINNKEYEITYVHNNYGMDEDYSENKTTGEISECAYGYVVLGIKPIKK